MLIPLVNEIFCKNIPERARIERSPNEYYSRKKTKKNEDTLIKRITDAMVRVDGGKYHFECESKNDGEILIRVAEYDSMIGINDADYRDHNVSVVLPETAVVFLRRHRNLPDYGTITYKTQGDSISQKVLYYKICRCNLDYIENKHLYILLPFYLMRYEHALKHNTESKYDIIENEAGRVYDILTKAYKSKRISLKEYEDIVILCHDVINEVGKTSQIKGRLVEKMGTEVLKTAEERGYDKGFDKGYDKGVDMGLGALVDSLKPLCEDFKTLYNKVVANSIYSNLTEADVRKYY